MQKKLINIFQKSSNSKESSKTDEIIKNENFARVPTSIKKIIAKLIAILYFNSKNIYFM
jgi:hypothetical protein